MPRLLVVKIITLGLFSCLLSFGQIVTFHNSSYLLGSAPVSAIVGDVNGDGKLDVIAVDHASQDIAVMLSNGDGTFRDPVESPTLSREILEVATADFNGDGKLDLVLADTTLGGPGIMLGNGDGTFQREVLVSFGQVATSVVTGDFNNDGNADFALVNSIVFQATVYLGDGHGNFRPQEPVRFSGRVSRVVAADLNGDHILDLAAANAADGVLGIALGKGDGTFQGAAQLPQGANRSHDIIACDLDGDGTMDLVTADLEQRSVTIYLGHGDGTFLGPLILFVAHHPLRVACGDFNGDGNIDIAATSSGLSVAILPSDGHGIFGDAFGVPVGNATISIATGVLTSSGLPDLVLVTSGAENNTSQLVVLVNTTNTRGRSN